jgi:hypothetical protein
MKGGMKERGVNELPRFSTLPQPSIRITDDNTQEFEMYGTDKTGKEERMMGVTYARKKR